MSLANAFLAPSRVRVRNIKVKTSPGWEKFLERELTALRIPGQFEAAPGGVEIEGPDSVLWNCVLRSRVAESVRVRMGDPFNCNHEKQMIGYLHGMPWSNYIKMDPDSPTPIIKVRCTKSRIYHEKMVQGLAEDVLQREKKKVLEERLKKETDEQIYGSKDSTSSTSSEKPVIFIDITHNEGTVWMSAAEDLQRRRFKKATVDAPLRENIAAACVLKTPMLQLLSEGKGLNIWDPFCGSGTLLFEALSVALGHPPGNPGIHYPFMNFPCHDDAAYAEVIASGLGVSPLPDIQLQNLGLIGSDIDVAAVTASRSNLRRYVRRMPRAVSDGDAGELDISQEENDKLNNDPSSFLPCDMNFFQSDFAKVVDKVRNCMILTNVPYGHRSVSHDRLKRIYKDFGRALLMRRDWRGVYVVSARQDFKKLTGLQWRSELRFSNGGILCDLLRWTGRRADYTDADDGAHSAICIKFQNL
eukprot:gene868-53_t